ncbi:TadE/TadG family type IV pilus assembly protein [Aestuariimicrobium sp. T2.26MG-19.2B]|uniref:TadE/TadG family type IV pilus assembly protein n=1 Tax=Aestuariimicrobium sp. T2.26MG-19.2B TaxID=3040679 RepID=UPI00247777B3|nr:TadE/TadG family type IV pilus assembly protein [Aestuariimicrobium sp. T2.26MG-19.2B]CAI9403343.1 hypothetical protein AESSP_00985 [Aestuariimicrobium sp. T2.26MG-19.2B]
MPHLFPERDHRGLSESVQWALLAPLVLLVVLGLIQTGVLLNARNTAHHAAMAAAETESLLGAQAGDGRAVADRILAPVGLRDSSTTITRSNESVTVVISGNAPLFFDIGLGRVEARAVMPLERP